MSASNLAVRMEHAATDPLSQPSRQELRVIASNERPVRGRGPRLSFTNRKFVIRDQGLRYLRIR
jgi:hypothetical protein